MYQVCQCPQKAEAREHQQVTVVGSRGRVYRVRLRGQSGNVEMLDHVGERRGSLCCHPRAIVPDPDAWVSQILALQTDEEAFIRTANVTGEVPPLPIAA